MKRRKFVREAAIGSLAVTGLTGTIIQASSCARKTETASPAGEFKSLSGFIPLNLEETGSEIRITGTTFSYTVCKITGLIISASVLGDEWLSGPLPGSKSTGSPYRPTSCPFPRHSGSDSAAAIRELFRACRKCVHPSTPHSQTKGRR